MSFELTCGAKRWVLVVRYDRMQPEVVIQEPCMESLQETARKYVHGDVATRPLPIIEHRFQLMMDPRSGAKWYRTCSVHAPPPAPRETMQDRIG